MSVNPNTIAVSLQSQQSLQVEYPVKPSKIVDLMSILLVCSTIFLVTATCNYLSKVIRPSIESSSTDKLPCRNCQYFSSNYHLKCAIHPIDVLTDRAADCHDYKTTNLSN